MPSSNPLNRPLAEGIRRVGFRKWYERELLSSHAHMTLSILAAVAMLASLEAVRGSPPGQQLANVAMGAVSGLIAFWALRRYLFLLMHAEEIANQANCPNCQAYGLLRIDGAVQTGRDQGRLVPVCCKKCGFGWTLND
jgi:hypothetical protein